MPIVQYIRNVNSGEATAEITLDGRPNLKIGGGAGEITDEEYARLLPLVVFTLPEPGSDEYESAFRINVTEEGEESAPEIDDLNGKSNSELRDIASQEGADITGMRSNNDIIDAIREKRVADASGVASLPATAVPPTPDVVVDDNTTDDS